MLQEPQAFATAVQGLLQAQKQALAVCSQAGGEHLCFLGSGRQEEDRYTHMVVASFLQKHTRYVSMVTSGYKGEIPSFEKLMCSKVWLVDLSSNAKNPFSDRALICIIFFPAIHEYFGDEIVTNLIDHNSQHCLVCNNNSSDSQSSETSPTRAKNNSYIFGKIGLAMKLKSQEMKGKIYDYIVNPSANTNQNGDKKTARDLEDEKRYQHSAPSFSIDDEHDPSKERQLLEVNVALVQGMMFEIQSSFYRPNGD